MIKLYNTLTKQVEEIEKKDHLNLYTCGPTVYNYAHLGNLRAFIMADLLYRTLKQENYNPKWVMNITDIDDKTIRGTLAKYGANATVQNLYDFTEKYLQIFKTDLQAVNVLVEEIEVIRVTDKIKEIQEFVVALINKGYAYKADDGVYFSIEKYQKDFNDYGQLVGAKFIEGKKVGVRVAVDEYEKDDLSDFALWKAHNKETDGQIFWEHPILGKGRPGWHIECSVINQVAFNGSVTDIHTGGVDLVFPHHTNEIAQSQAYFGKGNFVKHWFHSEHLLVEGKKMSKSAGTFYVLSDLINKGFSGQDFRYLMLSSSYRNQQNFTFEELLAVKTARERHFKNNGGNNLPPAFFESLNEDLNFPKAIGTAIENASLSAAAEIIGINTVESITEEPEEITKLKLNREEAKKQKDFTKSDEIRKQIEALGYEVMDTPQGQKLKKKIII